MIIDIKTLDFNVSVEKCMENMKPHPKFSHCTFENYIPDAKYPSQFDIKNRLSQKMLSIRDSKQKYHINNKGFLGLFKKNDKAGANTNNVDKHIYIDGGYGVGKTHLLSACYNVADINKKAFLSFGELTYFFNFLGIDESIRYFSDFRLILLDEFELDDPATTRMMAKFFNEIKNDTLVITTSNTLPSDLGKQRFQVEDFAREMGVISNAFETCLVGGNDYRKKSGSQLWKRVIDTNYFLDQFAKADKDVDTKGIAKYNDLIAILKDNHPFKYFIIPKNIEALFIDGVKPFEGLDEALRFTHLIDNCYYYNTKIFIRSGCHLNDLFNIEMLESCFSKKFLRCLSRLDELSVFYSF